MGETLQSLIKQRKEIFDNLREMYERGDLKVSDDLKGKDLVVTTVEDTDWTTNFIWQKPMNKSVVVDEVCRECGKQVVMSRGLHKLFKEQNCKKKQIICSRCLALRLEDFRVRLYGEEK